MRKSWKDLNISAQEKQKQTEKQNCSALEERSSRNKAVTSEEEVGYSQRKERNQYTSRIAGEKGVTTTKICSLH